MIRNYNLFLAYHVILIIGMLGLYYNYITSAAEEGTVHYYNYNYEAQLELALKSSSSSSSTKFLQLAIELFNTTQHIIDSGEMLTRYDPAEELWESELVPATNKLQGLRDRVSEYYYEFCTKNGAVAVNVLEEFVYQVVADTKIVNDELKNYILPKLKAHYDAYSSQLLKLRDSYLSFRELRLAYSEYTANPDLAQMVLLLQRNKVLADAPFDIHVLVEIAKFTKQVKEARDEITEKYYPKGSDEFLFTQAKYQIGMSEAERIMNENERSLGSFGEVINERMKLAEFYVKETGSYHEKYILGRSEELNGLIAKNQKEMEEISNKLLKFHQTAYAADPAKHGIIEETEDKQPKTDNNHG